MTDDDTIAADLEQVPQSDLELEPGESDTSLNADLARLGIDTASLMEQALEQTRMAIAISDPHRPGNPIVYINRAFTELTGYGQEDAIGANCRFLQGPDTDPGRVAEIRAALDARKVHVTEVLNYRKDGSAFWNSLHVGPVRDAEGRLTHFYGSQWDVTSDVEKRDRMAVQEEVAEELRHRNRNLFAVLRSIVRITARGETDVGVLARKVDDRLDALGRAHDTSIAVPDDGAEARDLGAMLGTVLDPYRTDRGDRVTLAGDPLSVPQALLTPIGVTIHELATNALKYGAFATSGGSVTVRWRRSGSRLRITWTETDGLPTEGMKAVSGGMGSRIVEAVLGVVGGTIAHDWRPAGLVASVFLPLPSDGSD